MDYFTFIPSHFVYVFCKLNEKVFWKLFWMLFLNQNLNDFENMKNILCLLLFRKEVFFWRLA